MNYLIFSVLSGDFFFKIKRFQKKCMAQTVWVQIRTDMLSILIWVQTLGNGVQRVSTGKERVKSKVFCLK